MKLTKQWLKKQNACLSGIEWFSKQKTTSLSILMKKALHEEQFVFANWAIVRLMTQQQKVQYACFAALQSLTTFEKTYPYDQRPRQAIEVALRWILNPLDENKKAALEAAEAAEAAWSAARSAAWSARSAATSAAWSARSAATSAATSPARSAESATSAAESAAKSAAESAAWSATWLAMWKKLLLYGLKILAKQTVVKSVKHFLRGK